MKIDVGNRDIHLPLNKLKLPTETKSMLLAMNCSESKKNYVTHRFSLNISLALYVTKNLNSMLSSQPMF